MTSFVRDQQSNWRKSNCRQSPASEGELLDPERAIGHLASKNRARIISAFDFTIDGAPASVEPLLQEQRFQGLKVTGAVSSLLGQEGIYAQGLWYDNKGRFDWVWAHIDNVLRLEVRHDTRFRGGVEAGAKTINLGCSSAHGSSGQLGQPAHNLRQLRPWNLAFDGGLKAKRKEPYDEVTTTNPNTSSGGKGRKRRLTGWAKA
ncbi:hypothetical protein RhiTH_006927 [Rhizoctonia solani]